MGMLIMGHLVLPAATGLNGWHAINGSASYRKIKSRQKRIIKAVFTRYSRTFHTWRVLVMLEPYAVKVACTVLRGEGSRETPNLPGVARGFECWLQNYHLRESRYHFLINRLQPSGNTRIL